MIRYYLNEEPILKNVPTYQLANPDERNHVFSQMNRMVIKKTNESGGYGMLMGNVATEEEMERYKEEVIKDPRQYIAQPIINLSSSPCYMNGHLKPRRIDLRPYALWARWNPNCSRRIDESGTKRRIIGGQFLTGRRQ
jgi:uncharacterized circularly permuted ATP-grasp superfamily protein